MARRLLGTTSFLGNTSAYAAQTYTLTPAENKHVQDYHVVNFVNGINCVVTADIYNVDGTNNCLLTSFSIAASSNISKVVRGLFVPRTVLFSFTPATTASSTLAFSMNIYEAAEML